VSTPVPDPKRWSSPPGRHVKMVINADMHVREAVAATTFTQNIHS
jgi:hypothetical protein